MSEKLKPCPFCGGDAELRTSSCPELPWALVGCTNCCAEGGVLMSPAEAIRLWNTRKDASHE